MHSWGLTHDETMVALGDIMPRVERKGLSFHNNPDIVSYCEPCLLCSPPRVFDRFQATSNVMNVLLLSERSFVGRCCS